MHSYAFERTVFGHGTPSHYNIFHNWSKNNNVESILYDEIAFLDGGVSNLADYNPNIHLLYRRQAPVA